MARKKDDLTCTIVTKKPVQMTGGEVVAAFTEVECGDDAEMSYADALDCVGADNAVFRKGSPVPSLNNPEAADALLAEGKRAKSSKSAAVA